MEEEQYIGYLKYEGRLVGDGLLDARKAAQALLGFDEAIRFFVCQQSPIMRDIDFEIPVRIRKGSWEALIPHTLIDWLKTAVGAGATAYLVTAAKKMAENDFDNKGMKDIFIHAVEAIQWMIRIGKHLGEVTKKRFENVRFAKQNTEIGLPNADGIYLYIPRKFFEFYISASPRLLKKIAELVEMERQLEVGVFKDGELVIEGIQYQQRHIFTLKDETEEILFPELKHEQPVVLEGHATRGNENTNTLGFMYKGHILACYPESGSVVRFKNTLFLNCRIHGRVSRLDKYGGYNEFKPKIIFSHIEPLESDDSSQSLFK